MGILPWIGIYALESLFFAWLLFWGGARRLEGSWLAELVAFKGSVTSADGLKLLAWIFWVSGTCWFLAGLFVPGVRWA